MKPFDMQLGFNKLNDMQQGYFLNYTCYLGINKRKYHNSPQ